MSSSYSFCSMEELRSTKLVTKWVDEVKDEISAYLDEDDRVHTFSSICPHQGGDFWFNKKTQKIECKWHGLIYCPRKLECVNRNYKVKLQKYEHRIENENIIIEVI